MKKNTIAIIFSLIVIIVIGVTAYAIKQSATQSKALEPFAQCLTESGAKFYGAFWCPHCNQQKALFGRSHRELPYVECSTPDRNNQTEICMEENIESYPTWKFADGSISSGVTSLEVLASKTGCELPTENEVVVDGEVAEKTEEVLEQAPEAEAASAVIEVSSVNIVEKDSEEKIPAFTVELE